MPAKPRGRVPVFSEEALDVSGFSPRPTTSSERAEQVRAVAEPAAFISREPGASGSAQSTTAPPAAGSREPRRYRTGRNMQLNLKVRQATADAFYLLADEQGWVLGEAFERAVAALQRELCR